MGLQQSNLSETKKLPIQQMIQAQQNLSNNSYPGWDFDYQRRLCGEEAPISDPGVPQHGLPQKIWSSSPEYTAIANETWNPVNLFSDFDTARDMFFVKTSFISKNQPNKGDYSALYQIADSSTNAQSSGPYFALHPSTEPETTICYLRPFFPLSETKNVSVTFDGTGEVYGNPKPKPRFNISPDTRIYVIQYFDYRNKLGGLQFGINETNLSDVYWIPLESLLDPRSFASVFRIGQDVCCGGNRSFFNENTGSTIFQNELYILKNTPVQDIHYRCGTGTVYDLETEKCIVQIDSINVLDKIMNDVLYFGGDDLRLKGDGFDMYRNMLKEQQSIENVLFQVERDGKSTQEFLKTFGNRLVVGQNNNIIWTRDIPRESNLRSSEPYPSLHYYPNCLYDKTNIQTDEFGISGCPPRELGPTVLNTDRTCSCTNGTCPIGGICVKTFETGNPVPYNNPNIVEFPGDRIKCSSKPTISNGKAIFATEQDYQNSSCIIDNGERGQYVTECANKCHGLVGAPNHINSLEQCLMFNTEAECTGKECSKECLPKLWKWVPLEVNGIFKGYYQTDELVSGTNNIKYCDLSNPVVSQECSLGSINPMYLEDCTCKNCYWSLTTSRKLDPYDQHGFQNPVFDPNSDPDEKVYEYVCQDCSCDYKEDNPESQKIHENSNNP
jgi:hypothetical protein